MAFSLEKVVPWGRSFGEYVAMFALSDADLHLRVLGCADGPASFNAEMRRRGLVAVSIDPLYRFDAAEIRSRINETFDNVLEQTRANMNEFVWQTIRSVEELASVRMSAMNDFLSDYDAGKATRRYVIGELPHLPLPDKAHDLAICSHFLFLYSQRHNEAFHIASILELCRVAREVRVFPLLELGAFTSRHLYGVLRGLSDRGLSPEIVTVDYEFQKGGNEMMRVVTG